MAVFTETIKLDDQISAEAKRASLAIDTITKAMAATEKQIIKASALGDSGKVSSLSNKFNALKGSLQEIPPPMQAAQSSSMGLQEELAEMTGGLSIVAEVAGAVVLAFGAVVLAGAAMAIQANEAKAKMLGLFDALGEGKVSGAETVAMLDRLSDSTGFTRAKLAPLTQAFMTMGVTGTDALERLTRAAAGLDAIKEGNAAAFTKLTGLINAAAAGGQKLAIPFKKFTTQLTAMGLNAGDVAGKLGMTTKALEDGLAKGTIDAKKLGDALTDAATDKGAGPLARAGASLSNIWAKAQENISKFFEDIDVGPFLAEVKSMFDILGQANPSGQALKSGIGAFFKEVFATATKVVPYVKHFLLDVIIYGLKAYIALKPIIAWFKQLAANKQVMDYVKFAFEAIGAAILVVVAVVVVIVGALIGFQMVLMAIVVAVFVVSAAILQFVAGAAAALIDWVSGAASAASDFVSGLISGISNGAGAVADAVKNLAKGATDAFKSALGIHSPSKVMMQLGGHTGGGFAEGLEGTADDVHGAASGVADAAVKGASSPSKSASGTGGGGGGVASVVATFAAGSIVVNGAGKDASELSEEMISLAFERIVGEAGL